MTLSLGEQLSIGSMVYVAAKPIPFFWPMRAFIHHNPLHGLEQHSFYDAVKSAESLFHGKTYLDRKEYQRYWQQGKVCKASLRKEIQRVLADSIDGLDFDLEMNFVSLLTQSTQAKLNSQNGFDGNDVTARIHGELVSKDDFKEASYYQSFLENHLSNSKPIYQKIDKLSGSAIGEELDEWVIKSCLDFFDEGQSVWAMPSRNEGFFKAWYQIAIQNAWLSPRARQIKKLVQADESPEAVIAKMMRLLKVPEDDWMQYFTNELSQLHGWVGFIRWRESAKNYHWTREFPGKLIGYLAVRLTLSVVLIEANKAKIGFSDFNQLQSAIQNKSYEMYLRYSLYGKTAIPHLAPSIEQAIELKQTDKFKELAENHMQQHFNNLLDRCINILTEVVSQNGNNQSLVDFNDEQLSSLASTLQKVEHSEGEIWLKSMETFAIDGLLKDIQVERKAKAEKRPFVQSLFCIDTRSERIRRHLESVGDYETYGIAGFFGVPFSFMELGKGSENHLCPILLTPKNLVLEMSREQFINDGTFTTLEHALHDLKESVLTPFVTVEAIGLLFGFDMVGKTVAPRYYTRWRKHLHNEKPDTHILLDKMDRTQADSIVRAVQRTVIITAIEQEFGAEAESITDEIVRDLRECALGHQNDCSLIVSSFNKSRADIEAFISSLRDDYNITKRFARSQMERLGRIGFSLDEQVGFVSQALMSIGMTKQFSRFVLLVGHGSKSENNPYESALDCGACGGNHGLVNARVLAQMANKAQVRDRLNEKGLIIDDDVWFVPAMHNTTTDELNLYDLESLPSTHLIYLDRLQTGLKSASRLCAHERLQTLQDDKQDLSQTNAFIEIQRNAMDWSQVRPEWGLSGNAYFVIGVRDLTESMNLAGRSFLHSYDYKVDGKRRLLENILTGPLVVAQWINMEHYFSTVDNERLGSGSKIYHNVSGRFGVMSGNLSDLRTGLPAQTVLNQSHPYHEPLRLITVIEAPFDHVMKAINAVASVKRLVKNHWIRLIIVDPETQQIHTLQDDDWVVVADSDLKESA